MTVISNESRSSLRSRNRLTGRQGPNRRDLFHRRSRFRKQTVVRVMAGRVDRARRHQSRERIARLRWRGRVGRLPVSRVGFLTLVRSVPVAVSRTRSQPPRLEKSSSANTTAAVPGWRLSGTRFHTDGVPVRSVRWVREVVVQECPIVVAAVEHRVRRARPIMLTEEPNDGPVNQALLQCSETTCRLPAELPVTGEL